MMKVQDRQQKAGSQTRGPGPFTYAGILLALVAVVLAPAFWWPPLLRIAATISLAMLALLVVRAYIAALVAWRPAPDPPEKPAGWEWPTVDVLVPAYNEASVLPRSLDALAAVDYPADKIRFVHVYEARSSDDTEAILLARTAADPRFHPVRRDSPRGGKAAAFNDGLEHCRGELLVSLDADHCPEPDMIERAARWFLAEPATSCIKGRVIGHNQHQSFLAMQAKVERDAIERADIYARQVWRGFTFFGGGQAVFRRSVFEELGPFDEEVLTEDADFSMRLHMAGHKIRIDPGVVTREENPATFAAWWAQRKRWARGWMQVSARYLPRLATQGKIGPMARLDATHTLGYVLVPVLFALLPFLALLGLLGLDTRAYGGAWVDWMWDAFALAPLFMAGSVWLQDLRDGEHHARRELLGLLTLWPYFMFQATVFWSAFIDEFILRREAVYVKTHKTGQASTRPRLSRAEPEGVEG